MRGGRGGLARLIAIVALLPASRASAAPVHNVVGEFTERMRVLFTMSVIGTEPRPQVIAPADSQGPTVDPSHLEHPAALEHQLRAALRAPLATTRLTVTGGTAHLGHYVVGSDQIVHGHVVVLEGDAEVRGRIEGNLVTLDGNITVYPGASVAGDALAIGGHVIEASGVTGTVQSVEAADHAPAAPLPVPLQIARRGAGLAGIFCTLLILGFGLVTFGRPNLEIVSDTVAHSFGRSFLAGLLGQILLLPTIGLIVVMLVLTIAGIIIAPFAVAVYTLLMIIATLGGVLAVAHAMGERLTRRRMARGMAVSPNSYRYVWLGMLSITAVWLGWVLFGWVPYAGGLMLAIAALGTWGVGTVGFGAALLSRGGVREQFAGRLLPTEMMTDEYLWATPQFGVPSVKRPDPRE
ncbi:MAG TPA: hypothetical protein VHW65_03145 [Gemmatimonadales bacterium]|nr:hypothetical protein [Gemmatimonadales bacterium]